MSPQSDKISTFSDSNLPEIFNDDAKLAEKISQSLAKAQAELSPIYEKAQKLRKYVSLDISNKERGLLEGETAIDIPKLLENMNVVVPMVTQKTPEPEVFVYPLDGLGSKSKADKIRNLSHDYLRQLWEMDLKMQKKMEQGVRTYFFQKFIAFKVLWDTNLNKIALYPIPMEKVYFPTGYSSVHELPFIIELVQDTWLNIKKRFFMRDEVNEMGETVQVEDEERIDAFRQVAGTVLTDNAMIQYREYWEDQYVCWSYKNFILGKAQNPYYNWDENSENHFDYPCKPYIIDTMLSFGDKLVDDTTYVWAGENIQRAIDKRQRQIDLNADDANGQRVINGDAFESTDNVDRLVRNRQNTIVTKGIESIGNVLTFVSARPMNPEIFNHNAYLEQHLDNLFNAHGTSRGERDAMETATGRTILKDSDRDANSPLVRMVERCAQDAYNWFIQLLYVFGHENEYLLLKADVSQQKTVSPDIFTGYKVKVFVKDGSTLPRNPAIIKAEAVDLAQQKMMSLEDMYRILQYEDPKEMAKRAILEQLDPISMYQLDGNPDKYNVEAIRHLMLIINGVIAGDDPTQVYNVDDSVLFQAHLDTETKYLAGIEVDPDLPPFMALEDETQAQIQAHVQMELEAFKALQQQEMMQAIAEKKAQVALEALAGVENNLMPTSVGFDQ